MILTILFRLLNYYFTHPTYPVLWQFTFSVLLCISLLHLRPLHLSTLEIIDFHLDVKSQKKLGTLDLFVALNITCLWETCFNLYNTALELLDCFLTMPAHYPRFPPCRTVSDPALMPRKDMPTRLPFLYLLINMFTHVQECCCASHWKLMSIGPCSLGGNISTHFAYSRIWSALNCVII